MTRAHRNINIAAVLLPFVAFIAAIPMLWNDLVGPLDLALLLTIYAVSTIGITVGYHRLLTHRAFATHKWLEYAYAILGSLAVEGPVIGWVSDHRKHHAHADEEGDPHSPHVGPPRRDARRRCAASGTPTWAGSSTTPRRWTPRSTRPTWWRTAACGSSSRFFPLWVTLGLVVPAGIGWLVGGDPEERAHGLLLGRPVRVFLVHHLTFSINSICHFFGRRRFPTDDRSTNVFWLAAADVRRVLAPQPPRLPALRDARSALVGGRPGRARDPRDEARGPRLERGADLARAPGAAQGSRRRRSCARTPPPRPRRAPLEGVAQQPRAARPRRAGWACRRAPGAARPPPQPPAGAPLHAERREAGVARAGVSSAARPAAASGSPSGSPSAAPARPARPARGRHQAREVRQHHRVRLRVGRAGRAHEHLAGGVVHGEAGHPRGPAAQERAERHLLGRRIGRARRGSAAASRPGWPAACRAPPSRGRARSWRSPTAPARGCDAISCGSAITSDGRTRRAPSTPAGVRWKGVSSAPESVVGIAARAPRSRRRSPWRCRSRARRRAPRAAVTGLRQQRHRDLVHEARRAPRAVAAAPSGALPAARAVVSSA